MHQITKRTDYQKTIKFTPKKPPTTSNFLKATGKTEKLPKPNTI